MDLPLYMGKEHYGQGERALNRAWELATSDPTRAQAFAAIAAAEFQAAKASQVFGWHLPPRVPVDPKPETLAANPESHPTRPTTEADRGARGRFTVGNKAAVGAIHGPRYEKLNPANQARVRAILSDMGVPDYPEPTTMGEA